MNIVYARMQGYDRNVPSDAVARELEKLGHTISIVDSLEYIPLRDWDFVWSPYESVTFLGDAISKKLGIPHFAHVEVIPPWRYFSDADVENYGLKPDDIEVKNFPATQPYYGNVIRAWKSADIKTTSNQCRLEYPKKYFDIDNVQLRYPSIDVQTIESAKRVYSPKRKENQIITVARITTIKRYDLLVEVMNKVQTECEWVIIGEGYAAEMIKKNLSNNKVTLNMVGVMWGWERFYHMLSSKLMIYAMGGMPPIEAALLGCFPIAIEQQPTKHLPEFDKFMEYNFGSSIPIFKHTELDKAAQEIDKRFKMKNEDSFKEYDTLNKFFSGETGVTPSSINAKNIVDKMESYGI